jgi:hypothetical protein
MVSQLVDHVYKIQTKKWPNMLWGRLGVRIYIFISYLDLSGNPNPNPSNMYHPQETRIPLQAETVHSWHCLYRMGTSWLLRPFLLVHGEFWEAILLYGANR